MGWKDAPQEQSAPAWASAPTVSEQQPAWASAPTATAAPVANPRLDKITSYAAETDRMLGLEPGTSLAQLQQESKLLDRAISPAGARGVAQVIDSTRANLEKRLGRRFDPHNTDDALLMHREVMKENMAQFGNRDDALRAYNGGWDKSRWGNPETSAYVNAINGRMGKPAVEGNGTYQEFAPVRKDIAPASLNTDQDWIRASMLMYELWERKPYQGDPKEIADWGKTSLANFNYDLVAMAQIAHTVSQGTEDQKRAFLYMMDTYDNTKYSWEGTGRAAKAALTDPTNLIGVGTLGVATIGKFVGREAAVLAAKETVLRSMARTGVAAGIDAGIAGATSETIKQGLEVSGGRQESMDLTKIGMTTAISATAGVVLGTAVDVAASKITRILRGETVDASKGGSKSAASATEDTPNVSGVAKDVEAKVAPEADFTVNPSGEAVPRGAALTPDEILAAKARQQDGRLPADEVVPDMTGATKNLIDVPEANTGLRTTRVADEEVAKVTRADVEKQAEGIVEQLRNLDAKDLPVALEQLRTGKYTLEEQRTISTATRLYADELAVATKEAVVARDTLLGKATKTAEDELKIQNLTKQIDDLEARSSAQLTDDAFGSMAGTILNDRRLGSPSTVQSVADIMAEKGLTREDAQKVWVELVAQAEKSEAARKIAADYDDRAAQALANGDLEGAAKITVQKNRELASIADEAVPGGASFIAKLTEYAISNVFSLKTVLVNLIPSGIKTLVIPGLKLIATDPLSKAARIEAGASYSAMRSSFSAALQAAKAGFKYEQALLTRDGTRLLEGELALSGKLVGSIRIFPRILNATDEFLSRINYDSFIAGRAASEAAIKATEKGLTGKALDEAVDKAVKAALATSREVAKGDELVQPIINKGRNLGLTGDELFAWVEKEAMKNPEALRKGTDEEALNFVRDVLYKRAFTGEGNASKAAIQYEETMKKFPSLKLVVGQLFFRTPIRVFEEGVRLTPGLQILAPKFLEDLAGKNGTLRQVRAQSESMASLAIAGAVLSLYSQGKITGDGAYSDWKQQRTRTDGPLPEPYTIKFDDGSTWNYRSFDPLATPVKIMINGLERMDRLRMRESQGEFINKDEFEKALAFVTVGTTAIASAFRDANLVSGIDGTMKFFENLADPERKEGAMLKMVGEKLFLLVPNTLHKIAKDNDPTIKDPVTFWQVVEEKLLRPFGRDDVKTPYSYDVLGNPRQMADTGSLWNVFSTASMEERGKGMSEDGKFVMSELDRLSRVTGATFTAPTKHKELGSFDMREILAADGKSTLYDVWQKNYQELRPDQILAPILREPMPDGTFKVKAVRVELVQQTIGDLQDAAFYKMMAQESKVVDKLIETTLFEQKAKAGLFDSKRPY